MKNHSVLRVSFFTPWQEQCGIRDYSRYLLAPLRELPEIENITLVEALSDAARGGTVEALRHRGTDAHRFQELGKRMNQDSTGHPVDVAHIQHQYFLFGGVAPHKSHIRDFLNAITVPAVMTVHEIARTEGLPALKQKMVHFANRTNFLHPALQHLIVHTEADRDYLLALGVSPNQVHKITHGVPSAQPMPAPQVAKQTLGLEGKRVVTLFGFLSVKKGHGVALEAMDSLPEDVTLLFAGGQHPDDHTDYVSKLKAEIAARGLQKRVVLTGYLPEEQVPLVMAATDVALAPFLQSSGSGSLAALMAYSRPTIASDIPPHQTFLQETPGCLALFPSGNATALATQILTLLEQEPRRTALQAAAQTYATTHSYSQMARDTLAIYQLATTVRY